MIDKLQKALEAISSSKYDYLEARYHSRNLNSVVVENGTVKEARSGTTEGTSIRALVEGSWGSMTLESQDIKEIQRGFLKCIDLARLSRPLKRERVSLAEIPISEDIVKPKLKNPSNEIPISEKIDLCLTTEKAIRSHNDAMVQGLANYFDVTDFKIFLSSEGTKLELHDQKTTLLLSGIAKKEGILSPATSRMAGSMGFEIFENNDAVNLSHKIAERAFRLTTAKFAPSGKHMVILGPQLVRLLAHEAFGHTNEADLVIGGSVLKGRVGDKIANENITILDDPKHPGSFGWLPEYDDEGTPTQTTVMVDKGILKTHLHNRESAAELNAKPTGNARAFNHQFDPLIRMTNSVILGGDSSLEEMLSEAKNAILLEGRRMGQADSNGEFMFGVQQGREIKNGELTDNFYRAVTISGIALDVLQKTKLLSKEVQHRFAGFCGKGQTAFTGGGGPYMLTELNVGGRQ
ncbi:MAG: TldD/PmbA family protein [Candidatus Hodarchaeota archaeon]